MRSAWKPGPVAWGIVATYLLVAVQVTSWFRKRIPKRVWHTVHLGSFGLFVAGTVHGMTAGTDWANHAVRWGSLAIGAWVTALTLIRFTAKRRTPASARIPARAARPRPAAVSPAVDLPSPHG